MHRQIERTLVGLRMVGVAGWIANRIDPAMAAADENVAALAQRVGAPLLGEVEFAMAPDPQRIAALMAWSRLG